MKTLALALFSLFAITAHASDDLQAVGLNCVASNGVTISGKDSGRRNYGGRQIEMDVNTSWFGITKYFKATSMWSVKPHGELSITLETPEVTNDGGLYWLRGMGNADARPGMQHFTMVLEQPGYAGFQSPGQHLQLASASCDVMLQ